VAFGKECLYCLRYTVCGDTGIDIKYARVLDDARQMISTVIGDAEARGGPVHLGTLIAQDRADQIVGQSVSGDVAKAFFAPRQPKSDSSKESSNLPLPEMP